MLRRKEYERELADELRHHVEAQAEMYVREGLTPREARRRAQLELGGVEQVKEGCREVRMGTRLELFWMDVRLAGRALRKAPGFTAVAILTVALGIGANTAMFSVVYAVLLRALPFAEPEALVRVTESNPGRGFLHFSATPPAFNDWRRMNTSFTDMAAYHFTTLNLTGDSEPERLSGVRGTANLLSLLGIKPLAGRLLRPEEDERGKNRVVLLGEGIWRRRFGADPGFIGREIQLDGERYTVAGVVPFAQAFPIRNADFWQPMAFQPRETADTARGAHYLSVVARLKPAVTIAQAEKELQGIAAGLEKSYPQARGWTVRVRGLHQVMTGTAKEPLGVLFGAVALVLLIACANLANLTLVRGAARQRELAIQSALGATRGRLVRRLLAESVLLALAGATAGVAIAFWAASALRAVGPVVNLPRAADIQVSGPVLLFTLGVAVLTGLFFGALPAFHFSRARTSDALKEGARTVAGGARQFWRSALVLVQISLALVLLVGAGLLLRSFAAMNSVDPGFHPGSVLSMQMSLPNRRYPQAADQAQFMNRALEQLRAVPGATDAAAVSWLPLTGDDESYNIGRAGDPQTPDQLSVNYSVVTPGYFRALGIPIVQGRAFAETDTENMPRVAIVNRALAEKLFPGQNPIGQRIQIGARYNVVREIVGVAGDIKLEDLGEEPTLQGYEPFAQVPRDTMRLVLRGTVAPAALAQPAQRAIWSLDKDLPLSNVQPMEEVVAGTMTSPMFRTVLLSSFAGLALLLAAVGLYGVLAYAVTQRTREIGIRMALGATRGEILRMVAGHGMRLTLLGIVAGVGGALWLSRFVEKMLFNVTPTDPVTFVALPVLLTLVALAACWIPARRATKVDPLVALRYE